MGKCTAANERFGASGAVTPQTVLYKFARYYPAGTFVKPLPRQYAGTLCARRAQPSSSAYSKKNKVESLAQLDKLEKNEEIQVKINSWLLPCSLRSHQKANPTPNNG